MVDYHMSIQKYLRMVSATLEKLDNSQINNFLNLLMAAAKAEKNIYIMGNGGSASTATHFTGDFNKGISKEVHPRFRFICLNDNPATVLAYANDISYDVIFEEQLKNFLKPGELVIGISGSGNSNNVLRAIEYANRIGGITVGLVGYDGGALMKCAQHCVHIPINNMQVVEDLHIMVDHLSYYVLTAGNKNEHTFSEK